MKDNTLTTDSGINSGNVLDVVFDAALTKPDDPMYQNKMNIAKGIFEKYIEYSKTKEDDIKRFLEYYSNPDNITKDDAHDFTLLVQGVQQIDTELGNNSLAQSFQKNSNILNNLLSNNVDEKGPSMTEEKSPSMTEEKGPSMTVIPWRGGYKVQTGGRVGMFERLKSVFGLDDYWSEKSGYSHVYKTMYDTILAVDAKIKLLKEKLLTNNITHNFTDRQLRKIVICSSWSHLVSTLSEKEKAVNRAYNFIIERDPNKPIGTDDELFTECYRSKRNKITDLLKKQHNKIITDDKIEIIIRHCRYNFKLATAFINANIDFIQKITLKDLADETESFFLKNIDKSEYDDYNEGDDNIDDEFFPYIDTENLSGLTYAIASIYNVLGGTLFNVSVTALWSPMFALSAVELFAVKPALLAVDLTASTIAAIFQKCRDAKIVPIGATPTDATSSGATPSGGSKKTRHRKKNTKKNKKRKQRNTNRK